MLRTVFGIYVDPETDPVVRKNISVISQTLWGNCKDEAKYKLGLVLEGYKNNLHTEKSSLGEQFFDNVQGNSFRSNSDRALIVDALISDLWDAHNGWDNFSNEGPVAAVLASYFRTQSDIFESNAMRLFKTVVACRIGRGVSYNNGVSPRGKTYYDFILGLAGDKYASYVMASFSHYEIASKLTRPVAREQAVLALSQVKENVINQRLVECLDYLITHIPNNSTAATSEDFKQMSAGYINWSG